MAASVFGLVWWSYFMYDKGIDTERARQAVLIEEAKNEERVKVEEVIKYRDKIKVVYRDRIKKIKVAQDPTGCADTTLGDMGFSRMRTENN